MLQFQLIVYAIIKETRRGTTVPLFELAAKQLNKEYKLGVKIILLKLSASRDGPENVHKQLEEP